MYILYACKEKDESVDRVPFNFEECGSVLLCSTFNRQTDKK